MQPAIMDTRRAQMFPLLAPAEVDRIRHFGHVQSYGAGETLVRVGERGHGLTVILEGAVAVTRRDESERDLAISTHHPGSFMGELAQLSGRPALVDAKAIEPVEALVISPQGLAPCWWPKPTLARRSCAP